MDLFHHRDPADYSHDAYPPPTYFAPSRSQFNTSRSYPATPRPSVDRSVRPAHSAPPLGHVRNIISPKDNIPAEKGPPAVMKESKLTQSHPCDVTLLEGTALVQEEQHAVVKDLKSSYDQVREYIEGFNNFISRTGTKCSSLDVYQKPLSVKMPMKEWIKLRDDLNVFETDQKSVVPLQYHL